MKVEFDLPDRPLTPEEFANLPDFNGQRVELWEGNLIFTMSPYNRWHERTKRRIASLLEARGEVADTERGVICPDGSVPIANVGVLREETSLDLSIHPAEEFLRVVEVVSPGSRANDYEKKPRQYAKAGIPEYWIVDRHPSEERDAAIQIFRLNPEGGYGLTEKISLSELEVRR